MRRSVLSAILAAALSVFACSEQPTEAPTAPPAVGGPSLLTSCTAADIEAQINALFPEGDLRTSAQAQFSSIPKKAEKKTGTAPTDKAFAFVDFLLDTYYAGQLIGGKSSETFDQVLELISSLYCFLNLASPTFPSTTEGTDVVVALVSPGDPTTTIVVPSEHAAVTIPEGATPEPTLIAISLLPDEPPPLRTSLDQYPFFYHFSGTTATGPVTFNLDVTAGVCLRDIIDVPDPNLRLAHNVEPFDFGDVEILPRPAEVPGLDCSDLGFGEGLRRIGATGAQGQGRFAWARKLFLPAELHAASLALATTGVGGTTKKFSEFGVVDIFSNPGSFEPVGPTSATETGGSTVTRTVLVTSQNETPIPNVPVTFATDDGTLDGEESEQIVFTDEDGIASVSWTLPSEPGTYTLSAEVPEEDNAPFETNEPPSTNIASTPDVDFEPALLTFTVTVPSDDLEIVLMGDFDVFNNVAADNVDNPQFYRNFATFTSSGPRATNTQVVWYEGHGSLMPGHRAQFPTDYGNMDDLSAALAAGGYSFSISTTTSLTSVPASIKVLFMVVPTQAISLTEAAGLRAFVSEGGRFVLVSDNPLFYSANESSNAALNTTLSRLGAAAQDAGVIHDCGYVILPSSSLRSHQLTMNAAGTGTLNSLTIACATSLQLGEGDEAFLFNNANTAPLGAGAKLSETVPEEGLVAAQSARSVPPVRASGTGGNAAVNP